MYTFRLGQVQYPEIELTHCIAPLDRKNKRGDRKGKEEEVAKGE